MTRLEELESALRRIAEFPAVLDEHQPNVTDLVLHHWETVCELKLIASEALKDKPGVTMYHTSPAPNPPMTGAPLTAYCKDKPHGSL